MLDFGIKMARLVTFFSLLCWFIVSSTPSPNPFGNFQFPNVAGVDEFDKAKLGLFIHWGPVSQWGTEISFPLQCKSFPCTVMGANRVSIIINNTDQLAAHRQSYRDLANTFNPTDFNATALADLAFDAGFRYVTPTAIHCDGFSLYQSEVNKAYSMSATPFNRDVTGELLDAFRARGMRGGVYVCPSLWNNDDYIFPDALTGFTSPDSCCYPNYSPYDNPESWGKFVSYLHDIVNEITKKYKPEHYWFDTGNMPSLGIDTHLELLTPNMRAANNESIMQTREGSGLQDYVESEDHSEAAVSSVIGLTYASVGGAKFEVPGTLGDQWAFDPNAVYKTAAEVIEDLVLIVSKGGNYLLNIGLDASGKWADGAVETLSGMAAWMKYGGEAIHGSTTTWPFELEGVFFTASRDLKYTYAFFAESTIDDARKTLTITSYKPSLLKSGVADVSLLSENGDVKLPFVLDEIGLAIDFSEVEGSEVVNPNFLNIVRITWG